MEFTVDIDEVVEKLSSAAVSEEHIREFSQKIAKNWEVSRMYFSPCNGKLLKK